MVMLRASLETKKKGPPSSRFSREEVLFVGQVEMLRWSTMLMRSSRRVTIPIGMRKQSYLRRLAKPGGHKPFETKPGPGVATTSTVEAVLPWMLPSSSPSSSPSSATLDGQRTPLPTPPNPFGRDASGLAGRLAGTQIDDHGHDALDLITSSSLSHRQRDTELSDTYPSETEQEDENAVVPITANVGFREIAKDHAGMSGTDGSPVPVALESGRRGLVARKDTVALPRHLSKLLRKIQGLSARAGSGRANHAWDDSDLDDSTGLVEPPGHALTRKDLSQTDLAAIRSDDPLVLKRQMQHFENKMKYGVLTQFVEADEFAQENELTVVGRKFERNFSRWAGAQLLGQSKSADMDDMNHSKTSLVLATTPGAFKIPQVHRDPCPGCGATLQDTDASNFGYTTAHHVMTYIENWQEASKRRSEYAQRMHELMNHWEKHGRRVGEEWLDFMTQEEFNAMYRFTGEPFVCHRCVSLRSTGSQGKKSTAPVSAPDFTDKLSALKNKKCVVVLVVDIAEFPGSMIPDLPGLISMNNDVIIAVNKIDLLMEKPFNYRGHRIEPKKKRVSRHYLCELVRGMAEKFQLPRHRIRNVVPVSAKKGWYIDDLIVEIEKAANVTLYRPGKPLPTYFVGATNSGKSAVINAIASQLFVAQPPHPNAVKQYYTQPDTRTGQLRVQYRWVTKEPLHLVDMSLAQSHKREKSCPIVTSSPLPGTTVNAIAIKIAVNGQKDPSKVPQNAVSQHPLLEPTPGAKALKKYPDIYFFDTPGLNPVWATTFPLAVEQQAKCLMKRYVRPLMMSIAPGYTLFLSGLAAIDVVKGPPKLLLCAFSSNYVKTFFGPTDQSDVEWSKHLGTLIRPPSDIDQLGELRLSVKRTYLFECTSENVHRAPKADIYFCGLGWVSFYVSNPADVVLRVRTVPGVVHGLRQPLRPRELRIHRGWPKLPRFMTSDQPVKRPVQDVVELVAKPVRENEPVMREIIKPTAPKTGSTGTNAPFDFILEKLREQGKVVPRL